MSRCENTCSSVGQRASVASSRAAASMASSSYSRSTFIM